MAAHYDTAVVPARPRKPRDKGKAEVAVQIAQRWIVARLRNRRFFSLSELNEAIRDLLGRLNDRVTRHLGASHRALFEELERPALKPLPQAPYVFAEWRQRSVGLDYHVEVEKHECSGMRTPVDEIEWVVEEFRTRYFDFYGEALPRGGLGPADAGRAALRARLHLDQERAAVARAGA